MSQTPARACVLHVDDDKGLLRLVEEIFSKNAGLRYVPAATVEEAMQALDEIHGPVMLLVDRRMPGADVWSFVEDVEQALDVPALPTFVLSGLEDPDAVAEAYANGASAYIPKPMDADGFTEIARMLESFTQVTSFPEPRPR